jgi:hypothetical protein
MTTQPVEYDIGYQGENEGAGAYARPQDWHARPSAGAWVLGAGVALILLAILARLLVAWRYG